MDSPHGTAARLIARLRQESVPVDTGSFSLDASRARERFAEFRYVERSGYLQHLVEGIRGLGELVPRVTRYGADLQIVARRLDRLDDPPRRLHGIFGERFAPAGTPAADALGRIAVGIDMALGLPSTPRVVVALAQDGDQWIADFTGGGEVAIERAREPEAGLSIYVDRSLRAEVFRRVETVAELDALRRANRFSDDAVVIDREIVDPQFRLDEHRHASHEGFELVTGRPRKDPNGHGTAVFLHQGIFLESRSIGPRGFLALIKLHRAPRDVTEARLRRDDVYERALAASRAVARGWN